MSGTLAPGFAARQIAASAHFPHVLLVQGRAVDLDPAQLAGYADAEHDATAAEPYWQADPLHDQNIVQLTKDALRGLLHESKDYFHGTLTELSTGELQYLTKLFEGE